MKEYERENLIVVIEHGEFHATGESRIPDPLYIIARVLLSIDESLQVFVDGFKREQVERKKREDPE